MAMPAPSDPPKQYMRLCTNSQRPAPVMLLSGALSSHEVPPAQWSTTLQHSFHGAKHLYSQALPFLWRWEHLYLPIQTLDLVMYTC